FHGRPESTGSASQTIRQRDPRRWEGNMAGQSDFPAVFSRLKVIFEPHAARLIVREDTPERYTLALPPLSRYPQYPQGFFVGGVRLSKSSVSYHLMPVYMFPDLLDGISERLRRRMQGKSCFNFKAVDEPVFAELARLTAAGF